MKSSVSDVGPVICTLTLVLMSGCITAPEQKLRMAAADGDLLRVEALLRQDVAVQAADERGMTPLLLAVQGGHRDTVALLLEKGADLRAQPSIGV